MAAPRFKPLTRRPARSAVIAAAATLVLALALWTPSASGAVTAAGAPSFQTVALGAQGGEPSIAVDTTTGRGRNFVYVEAIGGPRGTRLWHSYDHGQTFSHAILVDANGPARGGDGDVVVNTNGDVIVNDLNVSHAWVQVSTDHGKTLNTGTTTAPEDDRPWLTADGQNVYVAYHDFTLEDPVVCTSTDGGQSFGPCEQAFGPGSSASQCAENTVPARPLVVDPTNGSLNFMYSCSTQAENAQHPPYGPLHDYYLAQSTDGGVSWTTYPVFIADTSGGKTPNYANIFGTLAIDSGGNYYALFAGTADDRDPKANPYHVYIAVSKDHGHTWSKPIQVDHDTNGSGTHVLPHFAVTTPGDVDVVWYGTHSTGEPNGVCGTVASQSPCKDGFSNWNKSDAPGWRVYMAQTTTGLAAHPTWTQVVVNPTITHYGRICTNGIVCGSSDRSLLDFISVAVDCNGLAHIAYATNTKEQEETGKAFLSVSNQIGGSTIAPPASCGS